jgi:molecular chaperone GrpE
MSDRRKSERPDHDEDLAPEESAAAAAAPGDSALAGNGQSREDVAPEPGTLTQARQMLAELRPELADREAKLRDAEDRHLRDRAELENFKRRMQRERAEALRYASEGLIRELLPVVDNLTRAVRAAAESRTNGDGSAATEALATGVELVQRQLLEALGRHGVTPIEAQGKPFDPALHEAVLQVETDAVPPGTIVDELAPGYRLHDRLLRAAQVSVAKAPSRHEN